MSSSNSPDWQMCRLRRETVAGLRALTAGFDRARENGTRGFDHEPGEQGWSIDQIVVVLLEREESHRKRSKRKRKKRVYPSADGLDLAQPGVPEFLEGGG